MFQKYLLKGRIEIVIYMVLFKTVLILIWFYVYIQVIWI